MFSFRTNPTKHWQHDPAFKLMLDLDAFSMSGVHLGERIESFKRLGPAEKCRRNTLTWFSRGLRLDIDDDARLKSITLIWGDSALYSNRKFTPASAEVRRQGRFIEKIAQKTEEDVRGILGVPYWRCEHDDISLFYEPYPIELIVTLNPIHDPPRIVEITVQSPPLFDDKRAREWYAFDRPWPPVEG